MRSLLPISWAVSAASNANLSGVPGFRPVRLDPAVLGFTMLLSLATGTVFGLMPALAVSRPDLNGVLRAGGRGSAGSVRRRGARSLLAAGQIALSIVLLIGAGLLVDSFRRLQNVNPGFDPHNVMTASVQSVCVTTRLPVPPKGVTSNRRMWVGSTAT